MDCCCVSLSFVMVSLCLNAFSVGEMFSSMAALEGLVETEKDTLHLLRDFRAGESANLMEMKKYVRGLRQRYHGQIRSEMPATAESVRQYFRVKDHIQDWPNIRNLQHFSAVTEFAESIKNLQAVQLFPSIGDANGAAVALQRIQAAYRIRARDIATGQIPGTRITPAFTARECFLVGNILAQGELYGSAAQWLETADEIWTRETIKTENQLEILNWLHLSTWSFNHNATRAREITLKIKALDPDGPNGAASLQEYEKAIANSYSAEELEFGSEKRTVSTARPFEEPGENSRLQKLCRGELKPVARSPSDELCYYETYNNPVLLVQPVKIERYAVNPEIYILRNVLLQSQLERITEVAYPHLKSSENFYDTKEPVASTNHSSDQIAKLYAGSAKVMAFFESSFSSVVNEIDQRAGQITNLNPASAEDLAINNYGLGGRLSLHIDHYRTSYNHKAWRPDLGNRMATLMFWFTDVEMGGATVFPYLNITLWPEKGSAAFWYNLFLDGSSDQRLMHSGCTVMLGSKWIATKWFRERGQDLTRPCGSTADRIPVSKIPLSEFTD